MNREERLLTGLHKLGLQNSSLAVQSFHFPTCSESGYWEPEGQILGQLKTGGSGLNKVWY